jgi:choice-of-anchor C domain-containing protein
MIKTFVAGLAIMALMIGLVGTAGATNLIVNGSFENGNYHTPQWQRLYAGSTDLTGWTIGAVGVDWHVATNNPSLNPAFTGAEFSPAQDGSLVLDFHLQSDYNGTISQTFATTAGNTYQVSFYLAGVNWFADPRDIQVDVNGSTQTFSQPASYPSNLTWGLKSFQFTATGSTATLTFSCTDVAGYWGPLLDNVSVESVVAPAPSTILLLVTGLAGLLGSRLRRKK